jgi:hypothetical protein
MTTLEERIKAILEPLQEEARRLDAEIAGLEIQLDGLKKDRRRIATIMRATSPGKKPGPKPGPKLKPSTNGHVRPEAVEYIRRFIERPDTDRTQIVGKQLHAAIVEEAQGRGAVDYPGADAVRLALAEMHQNGELRLRERRSQGGGYIYATLT